MYCLLVGLNSCLGTGDQGLRTVIKCLFLGRRCASGWAEDPITRSHTGLGSFAGERKDSLNHPEYSASSSSSVLSHMLA